ncbi:putative RCC1-like regulator of chromosome condensation protein [Hamiltosporidium magnivora]|uniref:Putative RCC1-like regulator of chromosome condensation protein n=2 Tax=Hamiltosporidium TaxID=1176354 RepID=A0A4Q9L4V4_9MICR|nr:putative RCC1-like regulator of chromosome condensation protein [Hamiltosporidium magnivora]
MPVYVFGSNSISQLGLGTEIIKSKPVRLSFFDEIKIKKVKCGVIHTLLLTTDGKLYSWGCNDECALGRDGDESIPGLVNIPEEIVDMAGGGSISVAISVKGNVYAWGTFRNESGVLGFTVDIKIQKYPLKLKLKNIVKVECGFNHVLLLTDKNVLITFGVGICGQLGWKVSKRNKNCLIPTTISTTRKRKINEKFVDIKCGSSHSIAINSDGEAFVWGKNIYGQLGLNDRNSIYKRQKVDLKNIVTAEGGEDHSFFVANDYNIFSCGRNDLGQLGLNDKLHRDIPTSINVIRKLKVKNISKNIFDSNNYEEISNFKIQKIRSCGHFTIIQIENTLFSFGFNTSGELGYDCETSNLPTEIDFDFGNILDFDVGNDFVVVLTE